MAEVSPFNPITGEASTIHSESKPLGWSKEISDLSPEARKELAAQRRAEADQLEAMGGSGPIDGAPTADAIDANLASKEESAKGIAKDPAAKAPMATAEAAQAIENDVRSPEEILAGVPNFDSGKGAETPRYTSQQFNPAIDATKPQTAAAQKDENAADEAATRMRLEQERIAEQARIQQQVADMQAKWRADMDKASADYQKSVSLEPEHVTGMMRLAAGLGAMGATLGGTPNFAGNAIQAKFERDLERQKLGMMNAAKRMEHLGAQPAQIEKFRDSAMETLLAKQKAQIDLMGAASAKMMARFPQAGDALKEQQAKLQAGWDQEYAKLVADKTQRKMSLASGTATDTTATGKGGGDKPPPTADTMNYANAMENEKKAKRLAELVKKGDVPTPEELSQIIDNQNKIMAASEEEKKSPTQSFIGQAKRAVGLLPDDIFPPGMSDEKKEAFTLRWQLAEPEAIRATGGISWMSNPEAFQAVMGRRVHQRGESAKMGRMKDEQLIEAAEAAAQELRRVSKVGVREQKLQAREGTSEGKPAAKLSLTKQDVEALRWARSNPGQKADAIKAKIRKDKGLQ